MIKMLTPSEIQRFIKEINNYDEDILSGTQFYTYPSSRMIDAHLVTRLKQYHINANKCVLCLLNNVFQRIGRSDLADEVRDIRSRMH